MAILKKLCFDSSCSDLPFSDYYTKQEVQDLIHDLEGLTIVIVDQLPATGESHTMYFVPNGSVYDEYMYIAGAWESLGSTSVDLSNYVTTATHTADITALQAVDSTQNGKIATLENDVDDIETALTNKQDKLTAGSNISISGNTISANLSGYVPTTTYNTAINAINDKNTAQDTDIAALQTGKQDKLTAGTNVQISGNTISATDTTYTAGNGLSLSGTQFSAKTGYTTSGNNRAVLTDASGNLYTIQKDTTYTAGTNVQISNANVISATDTKYTAGTGINIDASNVISATGGGATYTAGENIQISSSNVISATDTKYTAGQNIKISSDNKISAPEYRWRDYLKEETSVGGAISISVDIRDVSEAKTQSIPNNAIDNYEVYTVPYTGYYIFYGMVQFASNTSGARYVSLVKMGDGQQFGGQQRVGASPSGQTFLSAFGALELAKNDKVGLRVFQNSGSALSSTLRIGGTCFIKSGWF